MSLNTKVCKICLLDLDFSKYSGRSARCMKCLYASKRQWFKDYYVENKDHLCLQSKEKYHDIHAATPKRRRGPKPRSQN